MTRPPLPLLLAVADALAQDGLAFLRELLG